MESLNTKIEAWLEPKLEEIGAFLVDIRHIQAQQRIEIYLDRDAGKPGIDLDACADVSRFIQFQLDHDDLVPRTYVLEVSSPGMDNPFKVFRQYQKHRGTEVQVLMQDGRKVEGRLAEVDEAGIDLDAYVPAQKGPSPEKKKVIAPQIERMRIEFAQIKSTKRKLPF